MTSIGTDDDFREKCDVEFHNGSEIVDMVEESGNSKEVCGFKSLADELDQIFAMHADWPVRKQAIHELLSCSYVSPDEIAEYAFFDDQYSYTRNLVASDGTHYTILLLCWNAGVESPIHDHPCDGCFVKSLQGIVTETKYVKEKSEDSNDEDNDKNDIKLTLLNETVIAPGAVTYMDNYVGYHKVGNAGTTPAITLHVYTPPYQKCKVWKSPENFAACTECKVTYYSQYGKKTNSFGGGCSAGGCGGGGSGQGTSSNNSDSTTG